MNRANQIALFQATNQGLLNIRQAELNYYINLNIAFGTQAALIGGFTYGVFTQNQKNEDYDYSYIFQDIYWITSAGTIAASVHVIITTMLLQVLGPGLALHGPVGSVANAADGLRREQKTVITAFIVMMILFSLSTVLSFWAVMSQESAIGGTVVFIIAGRYWYFYSERIYLRFYWDPEHMLSEQRDSFDPADIPVPGRKVPAPTVSTGGERTVSGGWGSHGNPIHDKNLDRMERMSTNTDEVNANNDNSDTNNAESERSTPAKKRISRFLPRMFSRKERAGDKKESTEGTADTRSFAQSLSGVVAMEGYLTKRENKASSRFYVLLYANAHMFFYESRQVYRHDPRKLIYKRPLIVLDYLVTVFNSEEEGGGGMGGREASMDYAESVVSASAAGDKLGNRKPRGKFEITLTPRDNEGETVRYPWVFRCDTEEELSIWVEALSTVSPSSFQQI
eukprot:gene24991-30190_t